MNEQLGVPRGSVVKNPPANSGDVGLIPGPGISPVEGNGNPPQHSCLGNLMDMDRGAWQAIVRWLPKSCTQIRD